jgi:hypothetical protein
MPSASQATASESMVVEGYEGHFEILEGGYTVGFETYTADADLTPLFAGLPDDRCQCEHWGYVIKGKVTFKSGGGAETFAAGDAYAAGRTEMYVPGRDVMLVIDDENAPADGERRAPSTAAGAASIQLFATPPDRSPGPSRRGTASRSWTTGRPN